MNYKDQEWKIQEHKNFNFNGMVANRHSAHCTTCDDYREHYRIDTFGPGNLYAECLTCRSWWFNRRKYNRTTSFMQNTIKRAKGIA